MTHQYDPNQPRVPAGHHDGGQWTGDSAEFGRTGLLKAVLGSHNGDGLHGPAQLAFLDQPKPPAPLWLPRSKPIPRIPLAPRIPLGGPYLGAIFTLFSLLSELNDREQQTIISFRVREFRHDGPERSFDFERVETLTRAEAATICGDYFNRVQEFTDKAYTDAKNGEPLSPQQLGTKVHKQVEEEIEALKIKDKIGDEKLKAELSFAKEKDGNDRRGARDTVRLDVYNRVDATTLCIDDIKTGRSELSFRRMKELASAVSKADSNIKRIIVTEVRPQSMQAPIPRAPTQQKD